ncbi:MAG TPA: LysR family transcriptional regulator, partial [Methylomirabilota bacterium]|nr:LysR family transcriptional regulator [Methylomirabilota bacterium]
MSRRRPTCSVSLHGRGSLAKREMKKHVISIANSGKVAAVNLETLKLYCDVVRLRSFSRGAASNAVSQSAASQAIQQLEAELDAA